VQSARAERMMLSKSGEEVQSIHGSIRRATAYRVHFQVTPGSRSASIRARKTSAEPGPPGRTEERGSTREDARKGGHQGKRG